MPHFVQAIIHRIQHILHSAEGYLSRLISQVVPVNRDNGQKGFTLIELMIVMTIMGLIFGASIVNMNSFRERNDLKISRSQLIADMRLAKTWARAVRSGEEIEDNAFNHQLVGYALRLEEGAEEYVLWEVWADDLGARATYDQTPDKRKFTRELTRTATILSIYPANTDLLFTAPFGKLEGLFGAEQSFDTEGNITIIVENGDLFGEILINRNGSIQEGVIETF